MVTVRTFLAVAAAKNWELHQMDVQNAFLYGDLEEEVYMKMLPGFASQSPGKYALDVILEVGLLGCKPAKTPFKQNHKLAFTKSDDVDDPTQYRRLVGWLIYQTITRLELSYCVHILAQFMQQPKKAHWEAAVRVAHYLKGNPSQGTLLHANCDLKLSAYCDSD
ncbi:uncharacterized mitochondrial protein AtMg00810-like [Hevea brasiliensis]|uniref:uncharacterized mitochondrial protein AtMg00810-like n=1 Tax=Hevea brasiliensis TaxID=3981 RepID=UPI0025FA9B99|nr:uncharacterized mitochondrial protein AtMg00810-like [Hevea brasiliensis]